MKPAVLLMVGACVLAVSCGDSSRMQARSTNEVVSSAPSPVPAAGAAPTETPSVAAPLSTPAPIARAPAPAATTRPAEDRVLASGKFHNRDYEGSGRATIVQAADGSRIMRLDPFSSQSGPSLRVWTSGSPWDAPKTAFIADHVDIGPLKALSGAQSYELPGGLDTSDARSVVIWCEQFQAPFIAAGLS